MLSMYPCIYESMYVNIYLPTMYVYLQSMTISSQGFLVFETAQWLIQR